MPEPSSSSESPVAPLAGSAPEVRSWPAWLPYLAVALLVSLLVVGLMTLQALQAQEAGRQRDQLRAQFEVRQLDSRLTALFGKVDLALRDVAYFYRDQALHGGVQSNRLAGFMVRLQDMLPEADMIRIIDAQGTVRVSSIALPSEPVSHAGEDYFRRMVEQRGAGLYVGPPLRPGADGKSVLPFAHALIGADGAFAGAVMIGLPLDYFAQVFRDLPLGQRGVAWLRMADLSPVYRHSQTPGAAESADTLARWRALVAGRDGGERGPEGAGPVAFRKMDAYPFYVAIEHDAAEAAAQRRDQLWGQVRLALLAAVLVGLAAAYSYRAARRRRQAETELRASQERLSMALDASSDGLWDLNVRTGDWYGSPAFFHMLGYEPGELDTRGGVAAWMQNTHPDDVERVRAAYREPRPRGGLYNVEFRLRAKNGSYRWILSRGKAVEWDEQGRIVRMVGTHSDITRRKQLEIEREAGTQELSAILAAAPVGIVLLRGRMVLRCNRSLERIFGYGPGEMDGQNTRVWFADRRAQEDVLPEIGAAGTSGSRVVELMRKDGSPFWARITAQVLDPTDAARGVVGIVEDISQERRVAAEMQRATELAEHLARARSEFLANMSHEIRTPMNAIIGMAHLALGTDLTPRQRRYLGSIETAGRHLLGLTNDILDLAKLDAGKLSVTPVEFETEALLAHSVALVAGHASDKGLELLVDQAPDVPAALVGDPLRIGQILTNFLSNAVKFTERGEVVLRVRREPRAGGGGDWLHLSVQDTGIGITPEQQARLFAPFEQADASIMRRYGGTGLGLVITRRMALLMNGEVGVDSEIGGGSTFWFRMPLEAASQESQVDPGMDAQLVGRRVLVVDDHASARHLACEILRRAGCVVQEADSGESALREAGLAARGGQPWEVALVDEQMPGFDGLSVARQLLAGQPGLRIALLSGRSGDAPLEAARQAGVAEVLGKPALAGALRDAVQALLSDTRQSPRPAVVVERGPDLSALRGATVLLVEDNELNRELATELLERLGLVVETASDGAQAVQKVRERPYDGVLMDMQMPVMDGLTATQEIRRLPGRSGLPIIALTANALSGDRDQCLAAGMDDYLSKPVDPIVLQDTLARWVRPWATGAGAADTAGATGAPPPRAAVPAPADEPAPTPSAPGPAPAPKPPVDLVLPGVDVALGLGRSLGDMDLYVAMLGMFCSSERDFPQRLDAMLEADDWPQAERMVHDLKGATAWIGAVTLRDQVAALEQLVKGRVERARIDAARAEVSAALGLLIDGIVARLPAGAPGVGPGEGPGAAG